MTREDIIRWAKKAGVPQTHWGDLSLEYDIKVLAELSALAYSAGAKAERDRMNVNLIHSCHPECDNLVCVRVRQEVKAEREACATLLERQVNLEGINDDPALTAFVVNLLRVCAAAIRARGET